MTTIRMLPPSIGPFAVDPMIVNGRSYSPTAAAYQDVPDFDAGVLEGNGWTRIAEAGTTAQRPTLPGSSQAGLKNRQFFDSTLGYVVIHDGANWKNPATGASV